MSQRVMEFTSTEQNKRLFQHEAGELGVAYLMVVDQVWSLWRMLKIACRHVPELDEALSGRLAPKLARVLSRIPERYRDRSEVWTALRELELAWDEGEDEVFLSTLRALRDGATRPRPDRPRPIRSLTTAESDPIN